jgi:hypothetical protein
MSLLYFVSSLFYFRIYFILLLCDPIFLTIKTYCRVKPVSHKLCPVHTKKNAAIKAKVEKLMKSGFIYPIPMTE